MKIFRMYHTSINISYIDEIVSAMRRGETVIYPTDSLYAIGCDALNNRAVEQVCRIKGINPNRQRLSMVCAGIAQAAEFARIDNRAFAVLKDNLPGPFTFVLPATTRLAKAFKGRKEVGVRVPDDSIARTLAEALGNPILSASVGWDDATDEQLASPEEVQLHYLNSVDMMIDGGDSSAIPTAVVSLLDSSEPEVLREAPRMPRL